MADLIVASPLADPDGFHDCVTALTKNRSMTALALWPDAADALEALGIETLTPQSLITNEDHRLLAGLAIEFAKTWWNRCFPGRPEPAIDGLTISTLYRFEIEQSLGPFLFNVLSITRALDRLRPKHVFFVSGAELSTNLTAQRLLIPHSLHTYVCDFPLHRLFAGNAGHAEIEARQYPRGHASGSTILSKMARGLDELIRDRDFEKAWATFRRWRAVRTNIAFRTKGEIVVTGGGRCLFGLLRHLRGRFPIGYLPHEIFNHATGERGRVVSLDWPSQRLDGAHGGFEVAGVSVEPVIRACAQFALAQMEYLRAHSTSLRERIAATRPRAYLTIYASGALTRLNLWTFHRAGVRTAWHGDGLGQYQSDLMWSLVDSALWADSPVERWLSSRYFADSFVAHGRPLETIRVTGYLDDNFDPQLLQPPRRSAALAARLGIGKNKKVVLFAISTAEPSALRLLAMETMFEVFKSVEEVGAALADEPDIVTIVKLHPGAEKDRALYARRLQSVLNARLVSSISIKKMIDLADVVVVYESTVGFEALLRGKHLVVFNHTRRPTYLTEMYAGMNHDLERGPCVRLIHGKEELLSTIRELVAHPVKSPGSPGLDRYLENLRPGYSTASVAESLDL